jgi:hypothetical protein
MAVFDHTAIATRFDSYMHFRALFHLALPASVD